MKMDVYTTEIFVTEERTSEFSRHSRNSEIKFDENYGKKI